ncbi:MAG: gamma-glutamyl-gamma-aminobutyrate hydrolase family protein [Lawsonibacter sp.]|nr:gamma-glutamyl-gamma-aminobutyrate hydrolase family protein [Lawsonibacter sp.]
MSPLIGITCNYDYRDAVGIASGMGIVGQDWNFVAQDYVNAIEKANGTPILIPLYQNFEDLRPLLDKLDGVLISGGHDVGPEHYNQRAKHCGTIIPMRDAQDIAISKYVADHTEKSLLGICRGIQILNVALGGTLYQDVEKEGGFEHHFGDIYPRNYPWHSIRFSSGSALEAAFGKEEIRVNSFHHQAVCATGRDVKVTATSADGVPEGIELANKPFVVGVQWHPEMMFDSEEQMKLFRAFVDSCT